MRPPHPSKGVDPFGGTRMPFGDHLEELRRHLWLAIVGFGAILILVFVVDALGYLAGLPVGVAKPVMEAIRQPVEEELERFHQRRLREAIEKLMAAQATGSADAKPVPLDVDAGPLAEALGLRPSPGAEPRFVRLSVRLPLAPWLGALEGLRQQGGRRFTLKTLNATEAMFVYFQVAIACGVVLGSPWIFWQLWLFVAAGLYPEEKGIVHRYLPLSLGLFLAGVAVCQWLVMPRALEAMLWFNHWLDLEPDIRLGEWLGFAVLMPLVFGIAFQTPLVMVMLERLGVVTVADYRRRRRLAWFLMTVAAAVLSPSVDAWSLLWLCVPLGLLYEFGIVLCQLLPRPPVEDVEEVGFI